MSEIEKEKSSPKLWTYYSIDTQTEREIYRDYDHIKNYDHIIQILPFFGLTFYIILDCLCKFLMRRFWFWIGDSFGTGYWQSIIGWCAVFYVWLSVVIWRLLNIFLSCPCFASLWGLVRSWLDICSVDPYYL